jgi:hypothetical protein
LVFLEALFSRHTIADINTLALSDTSYQQYQHGGIPNLRGELTVNAIK